jgi:hypothetical protein
MRALSTIRAAAQLAKENGTRLTDELRTLIDEIDDPNTLKQIENHIDIRAIFRGATGPISGSPSFKEALISFDKNLAKQRRGREDVVKAYLTSRGAYTLDELRGLNPGTALSEEQVLAAFDAIDPILDNVLSAASKAMRTGNIQDIIAFKDLFADNAALIHITMGVRAEGGRTLDTFNKVRGKFHALTSDTINNSYAKELLNLGIDENLAAKELARELSALSREELLTAMLRVNRDGLRLWPKIREIVRSILLLNPATFERNLIGTAFGVMSASIERSLGSVLGKGITEAGSDIGAFHRGMTYSILKNQRLLKGIIDEEFLARELSTVEKDGTRLEAFTREVAGIPGEILRTGGRGLIVIDAIGQRMVKDAFIYEQAEKNAAKLRRSGDITDNQVADVISAYMSKPPAAVEEMSLNLAKEYTFTNPLGLFAKRAQALVQFGPGFLISPFFRTPINLFKFTANRTPLGFVSKTILDDLKSGNSVREQQAMGRLFMGQLYAMAFWNLAASGFTVGSELQNDAAAKIRRSRGIESRSLQVGNVQIPSTSIEPLSTIAVLWADIAQAVSYAENADEAETAFAAGIWATVAAAENNTWLRSTNNFFSGFADFAHGQISFKGAIGKALTQPLVSIIAPPVGAQIARSLDPVVRDANTVIERILVRTPMGSKLVGPEHNILGEPVLRPPALFGPIADNLIPFVAMFKAQPGKDRVLERLEELGVKRPESIRSIFGPRRSESLLARPDPTINFGAPLSPEQEHDIESRRGTIKILGMTLRETLEGSLFDPSFQEQPLTLQRSLAESTVRMFHDTGKISFIAENPQKVNEALEIRKSQGGIRRLPAEQRPQVIDALTRAQQMLSERFNPETLKSLLPELFPGTESAIQQE